MVVSSYFHEERGGYLNREPGKDVRWNVWMWPCARRPNTLYIRDSGDSQRCKTEPPRQLDMSRPGSHDNSLCNNKTYFYSKTNQMHNNSNLFCFGTTLYTFRTVSPSIIRSIRLYIQHQVYVIQVLWLLASGKEMFHLVSWCCMYSLRLLMMDGENVRNM